MVDVADAIVVFMLMSMLLGIIVVICQKATKSAHHPHVSGRRDEG
jgi:hypothetical protein